LFFVCHKEVTNNGKEEKESCKEKKEEIAQHCEQILETTTGYV
jgi:hypothetical protein